ncbi:hypothetical protein GC163_24170 [bacterium]|nr:hypothetical protein [bacterium]
MAVTQYTWDPVTDSILEETDGAGNVLASYTNEPTMYGPLISQHRAGETRYFHFDALGSTRELTDDDENVTDFFGYDAWGCTVRRLGITQSSSLWVGRVGYVESHGDRGCDVRARQYSISLARWLQRDPRFPTTGLQPYSYCNQQAVLVTDPSGMDCNLCCCCAIGGDVGNIQQFRRVAGMSPLGDVHIFGHEFDYTAHLEYVIGEPDNCRLQWLECTNTWPPEYIEAARSQGISLQPFDWVDAFALLGPQGDWRRYLSGEIPIPCQGRVQPLVEHDTPATTYKFFDPVTNTITFKPRSLTVTNFAFRLLSAPDCDCAVRSHTLYYHQILWDIGPYEFPFGFWIFSPGLIQFDGGCSFPPNPVNT